MKRRSTLPYTVAFGALGLIACLFWKRAISQENLDRGLYAAVGAADPAKVADLLRRGANPNANFPYEEESLAERIRALFSRRRHGETPYEIARTTLEYARTARKHITPMQLRADPRLLYLHYLDEARPRMEQIMETMGRAGARDD